MRILTILISILLLTGNANSQNYTEGADLSNTAPGLSFTFSGPNTTIAGQMNTPSDGSEYFVIDLPVGCTIDSVTYRIEDPTHVGVSGFFQFGTNNQESYSFPGSYSFASAGQFPTVPFPVIGPSTFQCVAQANIAFISDWDMVFHGSCAPCIDPDIPNLSASSNMICSGDSVEITISGNLNSATVWVLRTDSCEYLLPEPLVGNSVKLAPSESKSYFIRGEGGCVIPGSCDSITILVQDSIDVSVNQNGNVLTANNPNATYQWVDCSNGYVPIGGGSNQTCGQCAINDGLYAVIVSDGICTDTSECYEIIVSGLEEFIDPELHWTFNENEVIVTSNTSHQYQLTIYDLQGRIFEQSEGYGSVIYGNIPDSKGLYLIQIRTENTASVKRFVAN